MDAAAVTASTRSSVLSDLFHPRCSCTLIDVGLNDGSTMESWALHAYSLIDSLHLGSTNTSRGGVGASALRQAHRGVKKAKGGMIRYMTEWSAQFRRALLHQSHPRVEAMAERLRWCVANPDHASRVDPCYYGFEPNPSFAPAHAALLRNMSQRGLHARIFSAAISTSDGTAELQLNPDTTRSALHGQGNAQLPRVQVPTLDVRHLVAGANPWRRLPRNHGFLAMKIDVEGVEQKLLRRLGAAVCDIDLLAVEWHARIGPDGVALPPRAGRAHPPGLPMGGVGSLDWLFGKQGVCKSGTGTVVMVPWW